MYKTLFQISTILAWILELWKLHSCAWLIVSSADFSVLVVGCLSLSLVRSQYLMHMLRTGTSVGRHRQTPELIFQWTDLRIDISVDKDIL